MNRLCKHSVIGEDVMNEDTVVASTKDDHQEIDKIENTTEQKTEGFKWTKDRIVLAIIFTVIMIISVGLLILIFVNDTFLFTVVRDWFIKPLLSIHVAWRVLLFLVIMILQSLFAPIPSELILLSGGMLFGYYWGTLIGVVGSMMSAAITFYLSKRGGRSIVDAAGKKSGIIDRTIYIFDEWIKRWGLWAIIVGRAVPVIMFDPVSYAAGLANVKDRQYFLATFIGSIPRAIFYSILGVQLLDGQPVTEILNLTQEQIEATAGQFNLIFFIVFGVLVLMFVLSNVFYYISQHKKKKAAQLEEREDEESTAHNGEEEETEELSEITSTQDDIENSDTK